MGIRKRRHRFCRPVTITITTSVTISCTRSTSNVKSKSSMRLKWPRSGMNKKIVRDYLSLPEITTKETQTHVSKASMLHSGLKGQVT